MQFQREKPVTYQLDRVIRKTGAVAKKQMELNGFPTELGMAVMKQGEGFPTDLDMAVMKQGEGFPTDLDMAIMKQGEGFPTDLGMAVMRQMEGFPLIGGVDPAVIAQGVLPALWGFVSNHAYRIRLVVQERPEWGEELKVTRVLTYKLHLILERRVN